MNDYDQQFGTLSKKKLEIETEMTELSKVLVQEGNVGMEGNLIDEQGYPRADIDIYQVRLTRQRMNCLNNDYKEVIDQIERLLAVKLSSTASSENDKSQQKSQASHTNEKLKPFLQVSNIAPGSPSDKAGFQNKDEIVQFGPFLAGNATLNEISEHVKTKMGKIILVKVLRTDEDEEQKVAKILKLEPMEWSGQGLVGCKFTPI
jgi:26S proteasome non-ATPase regulatory subunit 9